MASQRSRKTDKAPTLAQMERHLGSLYGEARKKTRKERAQDLYYDALEADSPERMLDLIDQALDLDPRNVDARLILLQTLPLGSAARIEEFRSVVADAARQLGKKAFKEMVPYFWAYLETRPYMRARQSLALELCDAGRLEEAVAEFEGMLALNPNDNQGVRYSLLPLYFVLERRAEVKALLKRYKESTFSPVFAWGEVLLRYLTPRRAGLEKALAVARAQNPFMEAYLKGHRKIPKVLPNSYAIGSRDEAICFAGDIKRAWDHHPDAVEWLLAQAPDKM